MTAVWRGAVASFLQGSDTAHLKKNKLKIAELESETKKGTLKHQ